MKITWTAIAAIVAVAWLLGRSSQSAAAPTPSVTPTHPTLSTFDVVKLAAGALL